MRQFVHCNGCNSQVPTPESLDGKPSPQFLKCETCEKEFFWNGGLTDNSEPLILFSIEDSSESFEPTAQAHVSESSPAIELAVPLESSAAVDWSVLGAAIPRRRPKEVSAIRKILPPVLGGLAAFPIATLILWYGFGRDIGTTGPTVAKYVPWIVPEKFRNMPFESSPPTNANGRIASGRPLRSAPPQRNTLPTLNRDETNEPTKESSNASAPIIAMEKLKVEPENPTDATQPKTKSVTETSIAKIPATVEALKSLLKEMENAPNDPKVKKGIFLACQEKLKELSQQSSELTGPAARTWSKQLEAISRKTLFDPVIPRVMIKIANRARDEFSASISGDFVATVIEVGKANVPSANEKWILQEKWASDTIEIPVEVLPGAWRAGSATLPATCMVFGRLLPMEVSDSGATAIGATGSSLVLKVHLLVPK